jgi:hypothetical protein
MSSDSRGTEPGTLVLWVPHWAATVRVFDNQYTPIATPSAQTEGERGRYEVRVDLPPGVYLIDVELSGSSDSEWVSIRAKKETIVPPERWASLQLLTPTPLEVPASTPSSRPPRAWAGEAEKWSRQLTWNSSRPGRARLFIFVQTPDVTAYPNFANSLTLLDQDSAPLAKLAGPHVTFDPAAGWLAFNTDLQGGFYIVSRHGPGAFRYQLPVYVCDGWETQLFLAGGKGPSFRSLTMHMAPHGHGFRREDEIAEASEAVLSALRRESAIGTVVKSTHLKRLLHSEQRNPWLAVLAAYALTLAEEENQHPTAGTKAVTGDPALKQDIMDFLRATIGSHPDVRALGIDLQRAAPEPFPHPPLLRIGMQRVQQNATRFASTVPLNSLTERALALMITSSPWSVWCEPTTAQTTAAEERDAPAAASGVAAPVAKSRTPRQSVTRVAGLGASAPVFRPTPKEDSAKTRTTELRRAFYNLPVFKAAQQMISDAATPVVDRIVINTAEAAGKLLSEIDPEQVSTLAGIPLGRAQDTLNQLKSKVGRTAATKGTATERAILQYALRLGSAATWAQSDTAGTPAAPPSAGSSLEECVSALRNAAALLSAMAKPADDPEVANRGQALAARLSSVAEALLRRADLIVLTDVSGKFLYANGAFTLILAQPSGSKALDGVCRRWAEWLHTLPLGRSTGVKSPADPTTRLWTVRRVAVEDESTQGRTAFVNILEHEPRAPLTDEVFEYLASVTPKITLNASFFQYGSSKRVVSSLEALERIAADLETRALPTAGAR